MRQFHNWFVGLVTVIGCVVVFNALHTSVKCSTPSGHVLITGGAGFVGRRFSHHYCSNNWKVTVVDNLMSASSLHPDTWPKHLRCDPCLLEFIELDCRDYFKQKQGQLFFNVFLHLAAVVGGRATIEGAPVQVADDLSIDAAAFQWAISKDKPMPAKMVYFSSSAAYPVKMQGTGSDIKLSENMINFDDVNVDIAKPDLTYGWAKLTGEYLARLAHSVNGLNVVVYRPMSGYGEDQHGSYPFKAILRRAIHKENPLEIWSNATRDLIYIDDVVDCVMQTMNKVEDGKAINLATGIGTSFGELAMLMARQVGYETNVTIMDTMPKGVDYRVGDPLLLHQYGCRPSVTLAQGIKKALQFLSP